MAESRTGQKEIRRGGHRGAIAVIGLGRFGRSLALELEGQGSEVLGIDGDPRIVQDMSGELTHVVQADSTDEEAMRQLGVHEFDRAVVGIGTRLESSILTASVLLSLGVDRVWSKAISEAHARILTQIGVHHVVRPEHEMGKRVAHLVRGQFLDYIEFDDGYALLKAEPPSGIHGIPLGETGIRRKYGVTIVGVKRSGQDFTHATAETVVEDGDLIIVSGPRSKAERFGNMG